MWKWIKSLFRRRPKEPSPFLECVVLTPGMFEETITVKIVGAKGLMLFGTASGGMRLIPQHQAVDQDHWQALWDWHNRDAVIEWVAETV